MSDLFTVNSTNEPGVFEVDVPEPTETPVDFHAAFLERASDPDGEDSQHALGAFLTLRIVDQFAKPNLNVVGLGYQISSAFGYLSDLSPRTTEVESLEAIVFAAQAALKQEAKTPLLTPLRAYAEMLEGDLRLLECVDVLNTSLRITLGNDSAECVPLLLQRGRVYRTAGRFLESRNSYEEAGRIALSHGDSHSAFLSRIGLGVVHQVVGNYPAARDLLNQVRSDAVRAGDRDAEARSTHDLAVVTVKQGDFEEGVKHAFRSFQLYENDIHRRRALADLGTALQALGHFSAAGDAFEIVLTGEIPESMRIAATLELVELATKTGNQMMFEKHRRSVAAQVYDLPPSSLVDFEMKVGIGLATFGNVVAGTRYLRSAIRNAEEYNLNDYLFRAEEALESISTSGPHTEATPQWREEVETPDVARVAQELQLIRTAT